MNTDIKVTVLTPTFNRDYILTNLFNSLCRQSDQRFLWLIVDDGSSDNTREVVGSFEENFEIQYIYKENGGKHTAINVGMQWIHTEYTFIVDSDDYLKDNAIELINKWIEETSGITGLAGIAGCRVNEENKIIGQFPNKCEYIDCLNSERRKYKLIGDKAEVYKTDLLKSHPFPIYEDERFLPESVVWNQFSLEGLKIRWYKEGIMTCGYLKDGLTSATKNIDHFRKNFKGYRDEFIISMQVLKFPYSYSAASVFYARCCAIGKSKNCLKDGGDYSEVCCAGRILILLMGQFRHKIGRY